MLTSSSVPVSPSFPGKVIVPSPFTIPPFGMFTLPSGFVVGFEPSAPGLMIISSPVPGLPSAPG